MKSVIGNLSAMLLGFLAMLPCVSVATISSNRVLSKGFQEKDGAYVNEGLKDLDQLLRDYYNQTKKDILRDKLFLSSFINDKEENLNTILQTRGTIQAPQIRPISPLEILTQ